MAQAAPVLMPQVGISVESCIITSWMKKPGDQINVGDVLFSYETDKSSLECESTEAGELLEIFYQDGDEVPVLKPVCVIGESGADVSQWRPGSSEEATEKTEATDKPVVVQTISARAPAVTITDMADGDIKISPRARKVAENHYIDISKANASGPYGRVIERDIREMVEKGIAIMTPSDYHSGVRLPDQMAVHEVSFATDAPEAPEYKDIAFSGIRRAISKNMSHSLASIPQLTHSFSFDATGIMNYRKSIKEAMETLDMPNITLNDFILYAVSRTILKYPELNAHMIDENNIRQFRDVHLGMAVDTPRGLMVPVITYANRRSLAEISAEAKLLAEQAIAGNISPDKLSGATFTISNLGTFGVEHFTPVINPPETGILGINNITERVRKVNAELTSYPAMGISLTYDHRAIDGAPASRFASELCKMLENFTALLAK